MTGDPTWEDYRATLEEFLDERGGDGEREVLRIPSIASSVIATEMEDRPVREARRCFSLRIGLRPRDFARLGSEDRDAIGSIIHETLGEIVAGRDDCFYARVHDLGRVYEGWFLPWEVAQAEPKGLPRAVVDVSFEVDKESAKKTSDIFPSRQSPD